MEGHSKSLADYIYLIKRRIFYILIPFALVLGGSVALALLLPPIFVSKATVLIESQQVPNDLVQTTVTSYADERIQVITQRVLSSVVLLNLIEKYKLFGEERKTRPQSDLLDETKSAIKVGRVRANVRNRGGRAQNATIAFTVSFEHKTPRIAQSVTNELVTLFLEENTRARTERASETAEFLTSEVNKLTEKIAKTENEIGEFKEKYREYLPENMAINRQIISRLESSLAQTQAKITAMETREVLVKAQLSAFNEQIDAQREFARLTRKSSSSGLVGGDDEDLSKSKVVAQLEALKTQLVSMSALYGDTHPDVSNLRLRIKAFERQVGSEILGTTFKDQLSTSRTQLADLLKSNTEQHPDVVALKRRIASLEKAVAAEESSETTSENSDNAAAKPIEPPRAKSSTVIQLEVELAAIPRTIEGLNKRAAEIQARIDSLEEQMRNIPQVERTLSALRRELADATAQYTSLRGKNQEALLAQNLEKERKAERFILLEPPRLPERPQKPDRIKILFLGFFLSGVAGLGTAFGAEALDKGIRGPHVLTSILNQPPLAVIPYIETAADIRRRTVIWVSLTMITVITAASSVIGIHLWVKPLDILWPVLLRRFGIF